MRRAAVRRGDESGTATAFVVGFAIVLLACAGLVIDGGTALNARMTLADDVEQAARAGAQEIDIVALRANDVVQLDPRAAEGRAHAYLGGLGYTVSTATAFGDQITVGARDQVAPKLLSLVGVPPFDISASATAQAVTDPVP
ncbi:MAG TPA: pilus assembly protein TadG-related protein [Nocardioides sp.]|uniref:pilus assembly protein TadG-related protein n=1 Tax=Nocardioides sp. TaxID=35761 RepID=UPI002D7F7373|nr:pilus assembly protein TadG-related protein [Nocardioides sp.]HET6651722.1 pilus assembly protein TadG-related protein [Nocardioides sp.]